MDTRAPGDINMTTNMPDDLLTGYHGFRANRYAREVERYHMLAEGQSPKTMIIGCADSRVDPSTIFSAGPGELFIVRNVAALALVPLAMATLTQHGWTKFQRWTIWKTACLMLLTNEKTIAA